MNVAEITTFVTSLGAAVAAFLIALGDNSLASPVRAAFAAAGPLIVMLWTFVAHNTVQAKVAAGSSVAAARVQAAATPAAAAPTAEQMAAAVDSAMHALMGAQPPAS